MRSKILHSPHFHVPFLFNLQPIRKGLSEDADHVADTDRLEQSGICELIGRAAADG